MSDVPAPEPAPAEEPWRRLDPRMLLVHPVNAVLSFLPVLVGITLFNRDGGGWQLLAVVLPIAFGLLQWVTTTYRVTPTQVELRRNLVSQKVLTARLDRVRSVELTAPLLHRLLGLAKVRIGTGSSDEGGFDLDALRAGEAERLRVALLRLGSVASGEPVDPEGPPPAARAPDEQLLRLDPRWARYAAFTSSGAVVAAGLAGAASQVTSVVDLGRSEVGMLRALDRLPLVPSLVGLLLVLVVLSAVFGVLGYLVTNWGFLLTRDAAGRTLRVRRGLLTTTETSLEVERVRAVELREPLGIRAVGAGRLEALTVGSGFLGGGSSTVAPYCPREVSVDLAERVVGAGTALQVPLREHGPVARRRRLLRALLPAVVVPLALLAAAQWSGLDAAALRWGALVAAVVLLPAALLLARDRYRRLGHALTATHLVVRRGSLAGEHTVLDLDGVISWRVDQTFFQRRSGVATLVATTAAGGGHYEVLDVPLDVAVTLAHTADPGLVGQFTA
ncbi:PH domain-containing protein [Nocardioides marmoraquaticus]